MFKSAGRVDYHVGERKLFGVHQRDGYRPMRIVIAYLFDRLRACSADHGHPGTTLIISESRA